MKHRNIDDLSRKHKTGAEGYEFFRRDLLAVHEAQSLVRVYELPPGKSAYPYHYHLKDVETFYILSGEGLLRTPEGEKPVMAQKKTSTGISTNAARILRFRRRVYTRVNKIVTCSPETAMIWLIPAVFRSVLVP